MVFDTAVAKPLSFMNDGEEVKEEIDSNTIFTFTGISPVILIIVVSGIFTWVFVRTCDDSSPLVGHFFTPPAPSPILAAHSAALLL
jgi:di/tricarboxylate transporter